jgi:nuclease HARBI1
MSVSQSCAQNCLWRFVDALSLHMDEIIHIPAPENYAEEQQRFAEIRGFPMVIGCLDGTHVRIMQPEPQSANAFYNRKHYPSINVMAVCNSAKQFIYLYASWPGSCHDAFILRQSALWDDFEAGRGHGAVILGDSGYPCRHWLLTPYPNPADNSQERFNSQFCTISLSPSACLMWKSPLSRMSGRMMYQTS